MADQLPSMFTCERMRARLTEAGCARLWKSVGERPPRPDEARAACLGCAIGARHAGVDVAEAVRADRAAALAPFCARCGRQGSRLIGGLHCVSCYNRQREVARGRDARGRVPGFAGRFGAVPLLVVQGGRAAEMVFPGVMGRAEAAVIAAKRAQGGELTIGFRRLAPLPLGAQPELAPAFAPIRGRARPAAPDLTGLFCPIWPAPRLQQGALALG